MDTHNRHFRYQWYSQFDWLEYSPSANKAFCFACRVFGRTGQQHEAFVSTGFHNWKTALKKFRVHQCTSAHKTAVLTWRTAERTRNNPETNVVTLVNHQTKNEVDENRRYLKDIIETLIFLGRQGISLRGHRENSESLNKGNFLELLAFRAKDNELIHQFLIKKEKGITYTSHDIQQQLLEIIGKNMIDVIEMSFAVFEEMQKESGSKIYTLKSLSDTRWACRAEALKIILKQLNELVMTLQKIADEDLSSGAQAQSLLNSICTFDFIFNLVVLNEIFNTTKILSKYLQYVDVSVCAARCKVNAVEKSLKDLRTDAEFQKFWKEAEEIATKLDLDAPQLPQQRRVPLRLGGGEMQPTYRSVEHYYQLTSYYPILDTIIGQLQERFSENDMGIVQNVEKVLLADTKGVSQDILEDVARFYELDQDNLKAELRGFANLVKEIEKEEGSVTVPEQGDTKRYKTLCKRQAIFAEDKGL